MPASAGRRFVILIVDDDKHTREGLQRALRARYDVRLAEDARHALEALGDGEVDVMLTDLRMPGTDGLELLRRAQALHPEVVCILLTAYGSVETAVEAMKQGAYDFLTKPVNLDHLDMLIARALRSRDMEQKNRDLERQLDSKYGFENLVGNAQAMQPVFDTIRQAAPTQATILITGASGTGKELVAHAIHRLSARAHGPFVAVHCAALSASLLESELFGHEKGAFTGADARRKGRFEMAAGGTLFLDEIGEIDNAVQVKLLRVLEERVFERVGGNETLTADIRLIAATNRDLRQRVQEGKFREDLLYRLDVINIHMPLLRERNSDIPALCDHFLREFSEKNGKAIAGLTAEAVNLLSAYSWPGNVRELRNTIEKMVVLSHGDRLTARDVPANIREAVRGSAPGLSWGPVSLGEGSLAEAERRKILAVLDKQRGNRTRAALELGISRRTLHRKLQEYRAQGLLPGGAEQNGSDGDGERDFPS